MLKKEIRSFIISIIPILRGAVAFLYLKGNTGMGNYIKKAFNLTLELSNII